MNGPIDYVALVNGLISETVPAVAGLGIECVELEEGRAVARLPLEGNANHFNVIYAGSLFCVGESLAGMIMAPTFDFSKAYPLIKNLTINYLRPATTDVTASAAIPIEQIRQLQAAVAATGKATWRHEVEITDTSGVVVATMSGEGQVRAVSA